MNNNTLTGAQILIESLKREGVEVVFGYPGGAVIPIFDAILDSPIELILVRHEQGATHMADGYARATGKPGVALVTSGPAATNTLTGIYTAQMDSVPLIVLSGQTITPALGTDAFQECDTSGMSYAVTKHSYLVKDATQLPRIVKESFHIAKTGRPGPVLIDLPKDTSSTYVEMPLDDEMDLPGYTIPTHAEQDKVSAAAELISAAKKPLLLVGHGASISGAHKQVLELAEKMQIPVVSTLLGLGAFPGSHDLSMGMLGMHGTAYANMAVVGCDLIFSIGSRWDDRITGKLDEFAKDAKKIHLDIDNAEFDKVIQPDVKLHGDAKMVLEQLIPEVVPNDTTAWVEEVQANRKKYPLKYKKQGGLKVQYVIDRLYNLTEGKAIVTSDVGQHQMWTAQFFKVDNPRQLLNSGGAGTMGFGFPAAIGAAFGARSGGTPNWPVCAIVGDGGFQMTLFELATAAIHKLPIKVLVMDNKYLGMVRQWQDMFWDKRYSGVDLEGNPDFVKLAESYGVKGFRLRRTADVDKILNQALEYNEGPCLIHVEVEPEANVFPMIPPGAPMSNMIIEPPTKKLEKPTGST